MPEGDHRPSYWLRYALSRGSAATLMLTFVLYSTRSQKAQAYPETACPECWRFTTDILSALVNIRNWWFDIPTPSSHSNLNFFSNGPLPHENAFATNEFLQLLARTGVYVFVMIAILVACKAISRKRVNSFLLAVAPPFLLSMFHISLKDEGGQGDIGIRDAVGVYHPYQTDYCQGDHGGYYCPPPECAYPYDEEACRTHAERIGEMAKTIEYLAKVNNQREKDIAKLSLKNDFLAESLARVYKYNKKIQNQLRVMPEQDSCTSVNNES